MILIIGGAYQGKLEYAKENYSLEVIEDFHLIVLNQLENNIDPIEHIKNNISSFKNKVIICDDISCGVVPVDELQRKWRETLGHVLAVISKEADEVVRVFCGLGMKIK